MFKWMLNHNLYGEDDIYKERNKLIRSNLGWFIWAPKLLIIVLGFSQIETLPDGLLGWLSYIPFPALFYLSAIYTIFAIYSMNKRRYCNICYGIGNLYSCIIFLITAYILFDWQFSISVWYLVAAITIFIFYSLYIVWKFVKNGKKIANEDAVTDVSKSTIGGLIGGVLVLILIALNANLEIVDSTKFLVVTVAIGLVFATFLFCHGVRYLVLPDDKMLGRLRKRASDDSPAD